MGSADREFWASLSLKHGLGMGARTHQKILDHFGSAGLAVENARSWLGLRLVNARQYQSFLAESWQESAQQELKLAEKLQAEVLCWADPAYPARLRETGCGPLCLYCKGDLSLLDTPSLAVVGSRECTRYGIELGRRIAADLSEKGVTIVSGLAYGIDREAHLGGLTGPGSSVAVLGTGLDILYPSSNRDVWLALAEKGLIVSEFSPGTKPFGANFPQRNRIISGLSLGVLVVEARTKSGSLITARLAMEQGRDVFAVPGPVSLKSYRGCHDLINQGARLVHGADDILKELAPQIEAFVAAKAVPKAAPRPKAAAIQTRLDEMDTPTRSAQVSVRPEASPGTGGSARSAKGWASAPETGATAARPCPQSSAAPGGQRADRTHCTPDNPSTGLESEVSQHLAAMGATHIDSLCRVFHAEASQMSRLLVLLELKGVVRRLPGGYYLTA